MFEFVKVASLPMPFSSLTDVHSLLDAHVILFLVFISLIIAVTVVFSIRTYLSITCGRCTSNRLMSGKTIIVTGSNTGIGFEAARDFAKRGARVILACRDLTKANMAVDEIVSSTGNRQVVAKKCDLSSLKSVRNFADDVISSERRIDVLVLNAGSGSPFGRHLTEDGLELQFQTNHLGHFLLTKLLLDKMKETAMMSTVTSGRVRQSKTTASRIVVTSSFAHRFGRIDLDNIATAENYVNHPFLTYCDTKLCNVIFTKELSRRLTKENDQDGAEVSTGHSPLVTVNVLHPGTIYTNGIRYNDIGYIKLFLRFMCFLYGQRSVEVGAQTIIHLAISEDVEGQTGHYWSDCRRSSYNPIADDRDLCRKLWYLSESLISSI